MRYWIDLGERMSAPAARRVHAPDQNGAQRRDKPHHRGAVEQGAVGIDRHGRLQAGADLRQNGRQRRGLEGGHAFGQIQTLVRRDQAAALSPGVEFDPCFQVENGFPAPANIFRAAKTEARTVGDAADDFGLFATGLHDAGVGDAVHRHAGLRQHGSCNCGSDGGPD